MSVICDLMTAEQRAPFYRGGKDSSEQSIDKLITGDEGFQQVLDTEVDSIASNCLCLLNT